MNSSSTKLKIKIAAALVLIAFSLALLEVMSRVLYAYQDEIFKLRFQFTSTTLSKSLDPFEMEAPQHPGHWVLRPDYSSTYKQYMLDKDAKGRGELRRIIDTSDLDPFEAQRIKINSNGFKGKEIDQNKLRPRVLMLGDSTTFGLILDDYPNFTQKHLLSMGIDAEVINAGVEGYAIDNIVYEMPRYMNLSPDIVTILIGWNNIFSTRKWLTDQEYSIRSLWLLRGIKRAFQILIYGEYRVASDLHGRELVVDRKAAENINEYSPDELNALGMIIDQFQKRGIKVLILSLPGLYSMDSMPNAKMLTIGHTPAFSNNPLLLARLTELFNKHLKSIALKKGVHYIDLARWSEDNLHPKTQYFADSVHLTPAGLNLIGNHLAIKLKPIIEVQMNNGSKN